MAMIKLEKHLDSQSNITILEPQWDVSMGTCDPHIFEEALVVVKLGKFGREWGGQCMVELMPFKKTSNGLFPDIDLQIPCKEKSLNKLKVDTV
ncbi:hypothetical protein SCLCIDRAFT_26700 [Scleroderma citrinum Foug A]|uniref:Uncharacterized protein n=1 Tax=Scleroderma citrinum Foug A TaxID=1036808 RepID=A0A0C3DI30_9AGAM|nr:hypothetical protein SCLCIDRAFT_26700 [Scleroderma citrinum Foug A]